MSIELFMFLLYNNCKTEGVFEIMNEKLCSIISKYVNGSAEDISLDANLRGDLGLTSLELVDMAVAIEDEFNIRVDDLTIVNTKTVGDILALIKSK